MRKLPVRNRSNGNAPTATSPPDRGRATTISRRESDWPGRELLNDSILAQVLFSVWSSDPCVVVPSPPGSGKTRLVTLLAAALAHRAGLRVAIAAQTRAQAGELSARLAAISNRCALIAKSKSSVTGTGTCPVITGSQVRWAHRSGGEILVATTARWLHANPQTIGADVLIVDEAYQASYADIGAIGALAPQIVCVGDPGQIAPVITGDVSRWDSSPTGPQQAAPAALIAAYGDDVSVRRLRHSWRLGPQTCAMVSGLYYRNLPFTSRRPLEYLVSTQDEVLPEMAHRCVTTTDGPTDRMLMAQAAERARDLLTCGYATPDGRRAITAADIAVVVPHVAQAAIVRAMLADQPLITVATANALQGIERPAVVAVHPLAGYRELSAFAVDPGRTCVALTRHRAHLSVVTDSFTEKLVESSSTGVEVLAAVHATEDY